MATTKYFIVPLTGMCRASVQTHNYMINLSRIKKEPITLATVGLLLIAAVATIGVLGFSAVKDLLEQISITD